MAGQLDGETIVEWQNRLRQQLKENPAEVWTPHVFETPKAESKPRQPRRIQHNDHVGKWTDHIRKKSAQERRLNCIEWRNAGLSFREIGKRLGCGPCRANQIYHSALRLRKRDLMWAVPNLKWTVSIDWVTSTPESVFHEMQNDYA